MTLRTRLLVTTLLVAAPLAATLFVIAERTRHADMQESIDNALDTEGCGPGPRGPGGPPPRGRGRQRAPLEVHPYTDTFVSARPDGRGPEFPAELRAALATADRASVVWSTPEGRGLQTAVRLAAGSAPCQILLARMRPRPGEFRDQLVGLGAVVVVVMLAVTIAAGPTVARIHRLSEAVRASSARGKDTDIPIAGSDEVASLAAAFNNARRDVRTHLTEVEARERTLREFVATAPWTPMRPVTYVMRCAKPTTWDHSCAISPQRAVSTAACPLMRAPSTSLPLLNVSSPGTSPSRAPAGWISTWPSRRCRPWCMPTPHSQSRRWATSWTTPFDTTIAVAMWPWSSTNHLRRTWFPDLCCG
jgi:HAMP domain-containing protein